VAGVILVRTVADPEILELSGTATLLWIALAEPITADELATELATVVRASLECVAPDVHTALADLVHRGVVTQLKVA
jgi:hypothetical protein